MPRSLVCIRPVPTDGNIGKSRRLVVDNILLVDPWTSTSRSSVYLLAHCVFPPSLTALGLRLWVPGSIGITSPITLSVLLSDLLHRFPSLSEHLLSKEDFDLLLALHREASMCSLAS
jgi:hypothetical protein